MAAEDAPGLDIKMLPKRTDECNWTYYLPGEEKKGEMPCNLDADKRVVTTYWVPEEDIPEEIPRDFAIHIVYYGGFTPGLEIGFGTTLEDAYLENRHLRPYLYDRSGVWTSCGVGTPQREFLNSDDAYFIMRCHQAPPPPVSVWMA